MTDYLLIQYVNKIWETRKIKFHLQVDNYEELWYELSTIIKQWANNIFITKDWWKK